MKVGTTSHPKFKKLQRRLKLSLGATVGLLECIWMMAAQFADDGDLSRFDADEIAGYMDHDGDPNELIDALVECRWLDRDGETLTIHDWDEHCPHYIHDRRRKREPSGPKSKKGAGNAASERAKPPKQTAPSGGNPNDNPGTPDAVPGSSGDIPGSSGSIPGTSGNPPGNSDPTQPNPTYSNPTQPNLSKAVSGETSGKVRPEDVFDCWLASGAQAKPTKLPASIRAKLVTRLKDSDWPWLEAIAKLPIPNDKNFTWQPDLDWLVKNDKNAVKLASGGFDRGSPVGAGQTFDAANASKFGDGF